jgi:pimeloyl-ACP methyl ester carboxylesterase
MKPTRELMKAMHRSVKLTDRTSRRGSSGSRWALVAGALAVTAAVVAYRARKAEREHPPTGRFVEIDGVTLHYTDRGEGPPVVLLHGNGAMASDFEGSGLISLLADRHRVIAFDRPGFGYSERPRSRVWTARAQAALISRALSALDVQQPIVVAHSWGTLVALNLAREFPDSVSGLVLVSGYYFPTLRADVFLLSPPAIPLLGDVMRYTISPVVSRLIARPLMRQMFAPRAISERFRAAVPLPLMLRPSQLRAAAEESGLMQWAAAGLKKGYQSLRLPVVIIAGKGDRVTDLERQAVRLHREIPGSELRTQTDVGHMLHYAKPEVIVRAVEDITKRTTPELPLKGLPVV